MNHYFKQHHFSVLLLFLCFSSGLFAQESHLLTKEIKGQITHIGVPLYNVNVIIKGSTIGTKTDASGKYTIKANKGDVILYSHIGYFPISIIVEDVTTVLNIEMTIKETELDEITISASGKAGKTLELANKRRQKFSTSRGNIDPDRAGYAISFIDGEDIKPIYTSLTQALVGKAAGVRIADGRLIVKPVASMNVPVYPLWDIDGQLFDEEPPLNLSDIKSVRILKTLAATVKYGREGAGGVIVVKMKSNDFSFVESRRKKIAAQYTNKNYYYDDALLMDDKEINTNVYTNVLIGFKDKQKAIDYYQKTLKAS
ncbi:MAG: carboxypeptidase-like regulatory domain-containing protein, partial [Flavobacteriaceae bacterium]|nr:carboxypeptidase-like regulatory domain-containing protein [Flavobacteriaceae bacterium]